MQGTEPCVRTQGAMPYNSMYMQDTGPCADARHSALHSEHKDQCLTTARIRKALVLASTQGRVRALHSGRKDQCLTTISTQGIDIQ